jgi:hypothetical protein
VDVTTVSDSGLMRGDVERMTPEAKRARLAALLRQIAAGDEPRAQAPALSSVQKRLWFFDQLEPGTWFYNVPATLAFDGALDIAALERSLAEIVRRHETLRTTVVAGADEPRPVIAPPGSFTLPITDLAQVPVSEIDAEIARRTAEETLRPFDLARGPLFRASLLRVNAERNVLFATAHHIVCDGLSVKVLLGELSALYAAFSQGRPSPLDELSTQYSDVVSREAAHLGTDTVRQGIAYWSRALAGAPPWIDLPIDRPRPAAQTFRGAREFGRISAAATEGLRGFAKGSGATLFMTLLAAFYTLLFRYTDRTDIVVGTPVAGRGGADTDRMIGCFVNMLPLRCDLSGDPPFSELVRRVRDVALGAYRHETVPFDRLVEELKPVRDPGRAPVFQVVLNMGSYSDVWSVPTPGLNVHLLDLQHEPSMVDVTLYATELADGILLRAVYKEDLFEAATIQQLLRRFETLVSAAIDTPDTRISALPLAAADERSALAGAFSADLEEV